MRATYLVIVTVVLVALVASMHRSRPAVVDMYPARVVDARDFSVPGAGPLAETWVTARSGQRLVVKADNGATVEVVQELDDSGKVHVDQAVSILGMSDGQLRVVPR